MSKHNNLLSIASDAQACTRCASALAHEPRPVFSVHPDARILIIGQAPGSKVHASGVPWQDASGKRLRKWLGLSEAEFYRPDLVAIVPMGFCYPGKGRSGDLPPRPECAPRWHAPLLAGMSSIRLRLLIGQYAQQAYLPEDKGLSLTARVENWKHYQDQATMPSTMPLPHPSPRNQPWLKKHPWFEKELTVELQRQVRAAIAD